MKKRPLANLTEIAKAANVSVTTASLALNGHARVADRTILRVRQAADKLDYIPNQAARRLARSANWRRSSSLEQVGFIIFDPQWQTRSLAEAYLAIMRGVEHELASHDAAMVFLRVGGQNEYEKVTRLIRAGRVDAWLVSGTVDWAAVELLTGAGAPFVVLGTHTATRPVHTVDVNFHEVGSLAAEQFIAMDHRRVGFIGSSMNLAYQREVLAGFAQAAKTLGLDTDESLTITNANHPGRSLALRLEEAFKLRDPMTALFTAEPGHAARALELLDDRGIQVPDHMSVIGSTIAGGNADIARIELPLVEVGRAGASLLREVIGQGETAPRQVRVSPTAVAGETCRRLPMRR